MDKRLSYPIIFFLFLGFGVQLYTYAQDQDLAVPAEEEGYVKVAFHLYALGRAKFRDVYYFPTPGKAEKLKIRISQQSEEYSYYGPKEMGLFRRYPGEVPGTYRYEKIASLELSKGESSLLIFLTPSRGEDGSTKEFNMAAMPMIHDAVGPNRLAFFNGTGVRLMGVLNRERFVLDKGLSKEFSSTGIDHGNDVLLGLMVQNQDSLKVVLNSNVQFSPNRRTLIVLMPPEEVGSFEIVAFRIIEGA